MADGQLLAVLQYHGIPTRLINVSESLRGLTIVAVTAFR
ncbi:FRG domain-containing protein [Streptomyces phaeochromogenes]|nr:FRG domain-containing protein [Streptomyces phaeochromogenes]